MCIITPMACICSSVYLQNWIPDYKKVSGSLKTAVIKRIYSQNKRRFFERVWPVFFMKAV